MLSNLLDKVGEWNPQLFRELKGRLNRRNGAIAVAISGIGQLLVFLFYAGDLPSSPTYEGTNRYCIGTPPINWGNYDPSYTPNNYCLQDNLGHWIINWQLWRLDVFITLSFIAIFALLGVGTYMLISDWSREEQRQTLNFLRLTPQPAKSILIGKMLGVPSLLYLIAFLALPFHFTMGLGAEIPFNLILAFYGVLTASCIFFYSLALLYGSISTWLGGFQSWLGSGVLLFFLFFLTIQLLEVQLPFHNPFDWLTLFFPTTVLPYLVKATHLSAEAIGYMGGVSLSELEWYNIPIGYTAWMGIGFVLANFALWNYWVAQGLKHRFHNPNDPLLSKGQSYWLSSSFAMITLGFVVQNQGWGDYSQNLRNNFAMLLVLETLLFLGLIAILSPHRQTLQDWARYRHQMVSGRNRTLWKDLAWGEKSPSVVAIALNLFSTTIILGTGILLSPLQEYKLSVFFGLILTASMILIYAAIAQLMLLMKTQKRAIWSAATLSVVIVFPIMVCGLFGLDPYELPGIWLFSALPSVATENAALSTIFLTLLGQWTAIALAGLTLQRQLQKAGESATKALLAGRSLPSV